MTEQNQVNRLDAVFSALADPTRRAIVARLALGETSVNDLAAPFAISLPAVSRHLKVLQHAGLISRSREAQSRPCWIEAAALKEVSEWIEPYRRLWEQRLNRLDEHVKQMRRHERTPQKRR